MVTFHTEVSGRRIASAINASATANNESIDLLAAGILNKFMVLFWSFTQQETVIFT